MELNGIHPDVIAAVTNRGTGTRYHSNDPKRRWIDLDMPVNEREALFAVGYLLGILPEESSGNIPKTTGLSLKYDEDEAVFSDEAVAVFCNFLRHTPHLSALELGVFPSAQLRQLLEALHTNTSVKELKFGYIDNEECGLLIAELLRHKTDLRVLRFSNSDSVFRLTPSIFQHGQPQLQKLEISDCDLCDEGTRLLVHALVDNKDQYKNLKELDLSHNGITSTGLRSLSQLSPDVLPSLEYLCLDGNWNLLDDENITRIFVRGFLVSPRAKLAKLDVRSCCSSLDAAGYIAIIEALEINETLTVLDILTFRQQEFHKLIKEQLIRSIPKMTRLQHLSAARACIDLDDPRMIAALRQNVSLFEVTVNSENARRDPRLLQILVRNKQMAKLDIMLGTARMASETSASSCRNASTIPPPPPPPRSLWSPVLAKVGHGTEGASPVFKILRDRLATWVAETSTSSSGTKRKHHGQESSNAKRSSKQG